MTEQQALGYYDIWMIYLQLVGCESSPLTHNWEHTTSNNDMIIIIMIIKW